MNKEIVKDNIELAVDVASIGGMSLGGITAVLGITIFSPAIILGGLFATAMTVLTYNSVKNDFEEMKVKK